MRAKTGHDYGFDHEVMPLCVLFGCENFGFSLVRPYFDPVELVRLANQDGRPVVIERVREVCLALETRFGEFYQEVGISVDEILVGLENPESTNNQS